MNQLIKTIAVGFISTFTIATASQNLETTRVEFHIKQTAATGGSISTVAEVPEGYQATITSSSFADSVFENKILEGDTEKQALLLLKHLEGKLNKEGIALQDVVQVNAFLVTAHNKIADSENDSPEKSFKSFLDFIPKKKSLPDHNGWNQAHTQFWGNLQNPKYPINVVVIVETLPTIGALMKIEAISISKIIADSRTEELH